MNYNYNNLTGSVLLRADSHSQKTEIVTGDKKKSLINENQFWGSEEKEGLYYDYESSDNVLGYTVSCEGWNDYTDRPTEKMNINRTKEWISDKIINDKQKNLCVIQGYAGCGKTTFVHSILRKFSNQDEKLGYYNFYIGHVKNSIEDTFIPSSIMAKLISQITISLQTEDGMMIYKKFVGLFEQDLSYLSPILYRYVAPLFNNKNKASLYQMAKDIYNNRNASNIEQYIKKYRVQFYNSYDAKMGIIKYKENLLQDSGSFRNNSLELLLFIDYLWRCAVYLNRDDLIMDNQIIVYDNLDIIDNHYIVADFIDTLRSVLSNYMLFRNLQNISLPMFKAIIVVRKITYASISRFVEVGSNETNQRPSDVDFLDISNLYSPTNILKHKARVLKNDIDIYIPENAECRDSIIYFLDEVLRIPNEIFTSIKFAELLNHNIRACSNMMEQVIESVSYKEYFFDTSSFSTQMSDKCRSSIWIHIICKVLKSKKILESLGYNLSCSEKKNYPTTLSRLILTYLCNRRLGCMKGVRGFISSDVTFRDIVTALEKIPFSAFNRQDDWERDIVPVLEAQSSEVDSREHIVNFISKMLLRNDATEEMELWRRPIYYTRNAFLLSDISYIKKTLLNQINNFDKENSQITSFCITDEGYTFIERIATHFEFYSVRYNNQLTEPICCILDAANLANVIERVYNQVEQCAIKQIWLMKFYMEKNKVSKNVYLNEWFHPRTENFQPQLHIVRTIYDHISYLANYREYLYRVYKDDSKIFTPLNFCLIKWIGKYLELYRYYFYNELKNTDGEHNNIVWLDLKYLYWLVFKDEEKKGIDFISKKDDRIINLDRKKSVICRSNQNDILYSEEFKITDEKLLNESMLLK